LVERRLAALSGAGSASDAAARPIGPALSKGSSRSGMLSADLSMAGAFCRDRHCDDSVTG
jgi:hypothetical protein